MTAEAVRTWPSGSVVVEGRSAGWLSGTAAYAIWGMFPAFFGLLSFAAPLDILAHRVTWTLVLMAVVLAATGRLGGFGGHNRRTWLLLGAGALSISINWGTYIYAVASGQVAQAALGYFINPLVTVLLGVVVFRERVNRWGICAMVLAAAAVAVITVGYGHPPLIALTLAASFATYGAIKKVVPLEPQVSLSAETALVAPLAIGYLAFTAVAQHHVATSLTGTQLALLVASGPMTAIPLLLFGLAAQRLPVVTMGLLQYVTPILQFLWAVLVRHEDMTPTAWVGFVLVWSALLVFSTDALFRARRSARQRIADPKEDPEWP
ncbi:MAG TPA: EamA family transporter RarD [Mycobacterium sp.]|nr:EamA family transporter RarD [Mycobacterium sp.]